MINKLNIKNFKCFSEESTFEFSNLNVFTGYNGRGKSSLMQSLLLMSQSIKKYNDIKVFSLNGEYIDLDLYEDICNDIEKNISLEFFSDDLKKQLYLEYEKDENNERKGKLANLRIDNKDYLSSSGDFKNSDKKDQIRRFDVYPLEDIKNIFNDFYYISADRLGPTKYEEKTDINENNPVGNIAQFKLNVLNKHPDIKNRIQDELRFIMDCNDQIEINGNENDNSVLSLRFNNNGKQIKSFNTGFGYTYILGILILLELNPNGTIFIENPEAHLHPLAQSRLMKIICGKICNTTKLQVFIETHSEHIINAVRLSCVSENGIRPENVSIYFFDNDFSNKHLEINNKGQILKWPVGFFDQQSKDLSEIIQLGMKK